ncbi:hypothetical protein [Acinetobacter dispersus]|uniref:hypothetical protein n=1 Tax=Acinetobacter dispersus TaxID=70348 RepID=UPI001F4B029F|nr:hypothetical protein [Acinetobacter dispersus]MCH7389281.1 hypothetical protein [Acinetobacter dispersus]
MKKRLLDTATILLDKFVNRYHDYEDFWGIGVLYTYCQSLDKSFLTFNLIDQDCFGRDEFLKQVNLKFSDYLDKYLAIHKKKRGDLAEATIKIAFDKDPKILPETLFGDYFQVRVKLIDSYGRSFMRYSEGYCVPHTLWIEQRNYIDSLSIESHHMMGNIHFPLTRPIKSLADTDILFSHSKTQ